MMRSELIASLRKYRGPENYLTNALATLLREFLGYDELQPDKGLAFQILDVIARQDNQPRFSHEEEDISIDVQLRIDEENLPDMTITSRLPDGSKRLVFVEAKDRADVQSNQLVRYRSLLDRQNEEYTCLTLLSRPSVNIPANDEKAAGKKVTWYHIYSLVSDWEMNTEIGKYLKDSFTNFLEENGMSLNKVTGAYKAKLDNLLLQDLGNLVNLMRSIISETREFSSTELWIDIGDSDDGAWIGVGFKYKGERFDVGIFGSDPNTVVLEIEAHESKWPNKTLPIDSSFVTQTSGEQFEKLRDFIRGGAESLLQENSPQSSRRQRV